MDRGDALARAERFGHRLEALAPVVPSAAGAPIQRVKWRWSASSKSWSVVGSSSSTSVPPSHSGGGDGEEYDDTYSQRTDPTVQPFLTGGRGFMGESGALLQAKGKAPSASNIRETAVKTSDLRGGSGLHELLPTNMGSEVAKSGNPIAIGLQSGARTSTAHQMFRIGGGDVGAHTGFAPKPTGGSGSTHTRGQAPAHDQMRKRARTIFNETDPDRAVNELMLGHLDVTPTGQDIMSSPYIEGMRPNLTSIGPIGPVGKKDPGRIRLAQTMHKERETVKRRALAHKRKSGRGRSPSPERMPIDDQGEGGDHLFGPSLPPPPIPSFEGTHGSWENVSNTASWLTAPQREKFVFPTSSLPISTPTPTTPTTSTSTSSPFSPPPLTAPLPLLPSPPPLTPLVSPPQLNLPSSVPSTFPPPLHSPSPFLFSPPPSTSNSTSTSRYSLRKRPPKRR